MHGVVGKKEGKGRRRQGSLGWEQKKDSNVCAKKEERVELELRR
jgi:hypothetical protein